MTTMSKSEILLMSLRLYIRQHDFKMRQIKIACLNSAERQTFQQLGDINPRHLYQFSNMQYEVAEEGKI